MGKSQAQTPRAALSAHGLLLKYMAYARLLLRIEDNLFVHGGLNAHNLGWVAPQVCVCVCVCVHVMSCVLCVCCVLCHISHTYPPPPPPPFSPPSSATRMRSAPQGPWSRRGRGRRAGTASPWSRAACLEVLLLLRRQRRQGQGQGQGQGKYWLTYRNTEKAKTRQEQEQEQQQQQESARLLLEESPAAPPLMPGLAK